MTVNKNDDKIVTLQAKIKEKKQNLKGLKFMPTTTCSIEWMGKRHNLHVLNRDQLTEMLIELNMYVMSAKDLQIEMVKISGYKIEAWMQDIKNKLAILAESEEYKKLRSLENKLSSLLSSDKRTALELESIEELLEE